MSTTELKPKEMDYVRLGNSGLKVSKIILGCMTYGSSKWRPWVLDEEESIDHIKAAYDAGINTFDTANVYSNGISEIVLGKAIKQLHLPREEIVVMTKVYSVVSNDMDYKPSASGAPPPDSVGYVNQHGLSRKHIFDSVKHSLRRLQLDYIDVLQCHRFDKETPISETHSTMWFKRVMYDTSACPPAMLGNVLHAMQNDAINNKLTPFVSMQNQYSLVYREEEREMFPTLKLFGVGSIPFSPLARGFFTHPIGEATTRAESDSYRKRFGGRRGSLDIAERVEELASTKGVSRAQIALAWVLSKEGVTAPVVGASSLANLKDLLGAVHVKLSKEDVEYLEECYQAQPVVGFS